MWKIIVAFVLFAALAMYMLSKGGDVDMSGEKHGIDAHPAETVSAAASDAASAATAAASAALPASAASN